MKMNLSAILLTIFIVLKLVGVINWSWWWVLSPLWLPLAIIAVIYYVSVVFGIIAGILK